jgi:hypothetical protein
VANLPPRQCKTRRIAIGAGPSLSLG